MIKLAVLETLADLEQEMARAGRPTEEAALHEAVRALSQPSSDHLPAGRAAERLGVSTATVKRWIERGTLDGAVIGGRRIVSAASVDRLVRIRDVLDELDKEGNPTPDEVRALYQRDGR
jgi:excisionase family DNA binding protein